MSVLITGRRLQLRHTQLSFIAVSLVLLACGSSNSGVENGPGGAGASGSSGGSSALAGAAGTVSSAGGTQTSGGASVGGGSAGLAGASGSPSGGAAGSDGRAGDGGSGGTAGAAAGASGGVSTGGGGAGGGLAGAAGASGGGGGSSGGGSASFQIMPLGDSITYGFNGSNAGYRGPLYNLLKASRPNILYVGTSVEGPVSTKTNPLPTNQRHNEGHASYTINDINNNLDGLDTATFKRYGEANRDPKGGHWLDGIASGPNARPALYPDVIALMIGTNNASDSNRAAVQTQLHALLTKLTTMRPKTQLLVAKITPSNRPNNDSYNAAVESEVKSFQAAGKLVTLVDMYTHFPSDGLYSDGVHPNDKGFAFMTQQWFAAIQAALPQ